eukprot:2199669-Pyramimonas_sp.AAC.1
MLVGPLWSCSLSRQLARNACRAVPEPLPLAPARSGRRICFGAPIWRSRKLAPGSLASFGVVSFHCPSQWHHSSLLNTLCFSS